MKFTLFVLWRALRDLFVIITCPIWIPVGLLAALGLGMAAWAEGWYLDTRRTWTRRSTRD